MALCDCSFTCSENCFGLPIVRPRHIAARTEQTVISYTHRLQPGDYKGGVNLVDKHHSPELGLKRPLSLRKPDCP
jgi:hypothetical protein